MIIKQFFNPKRDDWEEISSRPVHSLESIFQKIIPIISDVKLRRDVALREYVAKHDGRFLSDLRVSQEEIDSSNRYVSEELRMAIDVAKNNIERFHAAQKEGEKIIETMPGIRCWRRSVPINKVGLYVPGGSAPLFSTFLMLGIPALLAGCPEIVVCTPPIREEEGAKLIHPYIAYCAKVLGIKNIFACGGAHAVAAMAYGCGEIIKVDKIFGPGNQYVTAAKQLVSAEGVAIDLPAGPSEVLVIADNSSNPSYIAADLISQAEHGIDSQVILVTNSQSVSSAIELELKSQLLDLPRKDIAIEALKKSKSIIFDNLDLAIEFSNQYAPEHLILATQNYAELSLKVVNAGSVFLGNYSPESVGDYASGTNHTLPTSGYARTSGGVSLDSFVKKITYQELTCQGLWSIAATVSAMAEGEGLIGHSNALKVRLRGDGDV